MEAGSVPTEKADRRGRTPAQPVLAQPMLRPGWVRRLIGLAGVLLALGGTSVAGTPVRAAAPEPDLGPVFQGRIAVAGKPVPLPDGTWTVIGDGHSARRNPQTEAFGAVRSVVLAALQGSQVTALAVINTNTIGVGRGWLYGDPCLDPQVHYSDLVGNAADGACVLVTHVLSVAEVGASAAWVQALQTLADSGRRVPSTWLSVRFVAADLSDFLDVRYYFNPELHGFGPVARTSWAQNAWHRLKVAPDSEKAAFIDKLVTWGVGLRPFVRDGLHRRLDNRRPIPWPWTLAATAVPPALAEKLYKLEELKALGAIDQEQFEAQTKLLLTSAAAEAGDGMSAWVKALAKTVSWRAVASADTLLVSYLMTGDVRTAGSIALLEVGSKLAAYFGHEMLWTSLLEHDTALANPIELESFGLDRPHGEPTGSSWGTLLLSWVPFFGWSGTPAGTETVARPGLHPAAEVIYAEPQDNGAGAARTGVEAARLDALAGPSAAVFGGAAPTEQRLERERFLGLIPMDWLP